MIYGQSSFVVVNIQMIYLKEFTVSNVYPYFLKAIAYPTCSYSSSSCHIL